MTFLAIADTTSFIFMPTKGKLKIFKKQIIKTYDPNRYATEQGILLSAKNFLATELNTQLFHERQKRSFERQFKPDLVLKTSPLK